MPDLTLTPRDPLGTALRAARADAQTRSTEGLLLVRQPAHREVLAWLAVDVAALAALRADGPVADVFVRTTAARALATLADLGSSPHVRLPPWPATGVLVDALVPRLLDRLPGVLSAVAASDPWLQPLAAEVAPSLAAVRATLEKLSPTTSAAQASARGLALRAGTLLAAADLLAAGVAGAADGNLADGLVAQLWVRRFVLHDSADGEGHKGFAHVVDGEVL